MHDTRPVALLSAVALLAAPFHAWAAPPAPAEPPAGTLASESATPAPTQPLDPKPEPSPAVLGVEPARTAPAADDPLTAALREDAILAGRARRGYERRRTGAFLVAGGTVALPLGLVWSFSESFMSDHSGPNAGDVVAMAALASLVTGAICILSGSAERNSAAEEWTLRHPAHPVAP
jgi:hypothetical protein